MLQNEVISKLLNILLKQVLMLIVEWGEIMVHQKKKKKKKKKNVVAFATAKSIQFPP